MENIAIFYGGKSVEHEVSVITAIQMMQNIDAEKFKIFPVYIDKNGHWWNVKKFNDKHEYVSINKAKKRKVFAEFGKNELIFKNFIFFKRIKIYAALNCCHGTSGEDGVLQGVFESLNMPYSGPNILGSAICMNKIFTKQLFQHHNLPITDYVYIKRNTVYDLEKIGSIITYPLFVKPASLGSSVGISRCDDLSSLIEAVKVAFEFDEYAIVEKAVRNLKEINCSVQRINGRVTASSLETPISWEKYLTYEQKYISKSKNEQKHILDVKLPKKIKNQIIEMSKNVYEQFDLAGVIRIDYLFDEKEEKLYINEVNTIPGSLAFYLWKPQGISLKENITLQIIQAVEKQKIKDRNKTNFKSNILN